MKLNVIDSCQQIMDSEQYTSNYYILMWVNKTFDIDIFKKAAYGVIEETPRFRMILKRGFFNNKWVLLEDAKKNYFYEEFIECSEDNAKCELENAFLATKHKYVDIMSESPMKFLYYKSENKGLLVCVFHHAFVDGIASLEVVSAFSMAYEAQKNKKEYKVKVYTGSISKDINKSMGCAQILKSLKDLKPKKSGGKKIDVIRKENNFDTALDKDKVEYVPLTYLRKDMMIIKKNFLPAQLSVNDIIMYATVNMQMRMNEKRKIKNMDIPVGFAVNLRQYTKETYGHMLTLQNAYGISGVNYSLKNGYSSKGLIEAIIKAKKGNPGVGFYAIFYLMKVLPMKVVEKISRKILEAVNKAMYEGTNVTNLGKIDSWIIGMEKEIDDVLVLRAGGKIGLPVISVIEHKGQFRFSFLKYQDEAHLASELQATFIEELEKLKKGII